MVMVLVVDYAELAWGYTVDFVLGMDDALIWAWPLEGGRMIFWCVANLECDFCGLHLFG